MDEQMLGANIRQRREKAGLTLSELARRAGMAKSTISKIERGKGSSPISTLLRIARALETPLSEIFSEPAPAASFVLTRRGHGRVITHDGSQFGYAYEGLAMEMKNKGMDPFLLTIRPGDPPSHLRHDGQEFIYMLSGKMEFRLGKESMQLAAGDSVYFDSSLLHSTRIIGRKPVKFLSLALGGVTPKTLRVHRRGK
jgi:transcriptional regulator with XRE-family HTH domain